jgi:hypothetical protein
VPRSLARYAAVLRWARPRSSNGDWRPDSAWEAVLVYGRRVSMRAGNRLVDRECANDAAARWLRSAVVG